MTNTGLGELAPCTAKYFSITFSVYNFLSTHCSASADSTDPGSYSTRAFIVEKVQFKLCCLKANCTCVHAYPTLKFIELTGKIEQRQKHKKVMKLCIYNTGRNLKIKTKQSLAQFSLHCHRYDCHNHLNHLILCSLKLGCFLQNKELEVICLEESFFKTKNLI